MNRRSDLPPTRTHGRGSDPCTEMQADISALLDRELAESRVRRVLVHLEVCPKCHRFLRSLRQQVDVHRQLWDQIADDTEIETAAGTAPEQDPFAGDLFADVDVVRVEEDVEDLAGGEGFLDKMLAESQDRLGEVFYQLGRAYVMLSVSPDFFSITAREPVPIPEYRTRGKALLAGVSGHEQNGDGRHWAEARQLLDGQLDSSARNLDKGCKLLELSVRIRPDSCAARVMLGQSYMYKFETARARQQFRWVLRRTRKNGGPVDRTTRVPLRIYALESLGSICLMDEQVPQALDYFRRVVESGAMDVHPTFSTAYLNVASTALRLGRFDEAAEAFERHYEKFSERRHETGRMLAMRPDLHNAVASDPKTHRRLAASCPLWFGADALTLESGAPVSFRKFETETASPRRSRNVQGGVPPAVGGGA